MAENRKAKSPDELGRWLCALAGRSPRIEPNGQVSGFRTVPLDWRIPRRIMTDNLIYFIVNGSGEGTIAGKKVIFEPGNLLWVPAGVVHEFWMRSGSPAMTLYHVRFRLYERRPSGIPYRLIENAWEFRPYMEQIVDEIQSPGPYRVPRLRGLFTLLLSSVFRRQAAVRDRGERWAVLSERQRRTIAQYIRERISQRPTPADLAAELRLSHDYFTRIFRHSFGVSPRTWFMRERIRNASMALMESRQSVKEIAFEHGYDDVYLFSRQFKQVIGTGPRAFRRQHVR